MLPFLVPIVSMLASKGVDLLAQTVDSVTDQGVEKISEFVKDKTGIDLTKSPKLTPEEVAKLKQLEQEHEQELKKLAFDYYRLDLEDRKNAREMQMEALKQSDVFSKRFIYYYAGFSTLISFLYIYLITFIDIPSDNRRFADTILGVVIGTIITTIMQFFFGSSQGSKDKTDALKELKR